MLAPMDAIVIPFRPRPARRAVGAAPGTAHAARSARARARGRRAPPPAPPSGRWSAPAHDVLDHLEHMLDSGDPNVAGEIAALGRQAAAHLAAAAPDINDPAAVTALAGRLAALVVRARHRAATVRPGTT